LDGLSYSASVAFRKLGSSAKELLDCLIECRRDASSAYQSGSAFDWKTAAERLERLEVGLKFYLEPAQVALRKATLGKLMTIAEVDANSALVALLRLSRNTSSSFWFFWHMSEKGAKKLRFSRALRKVSNETGLLAALKAFTRKETRELRKHLEQEIDDAEEYAFSDVSRHPGEVARTKYDSELLKIYWKDIGYSPTPDDAQQPPKGNGTWLKSGQPPDGWCTKPLCGRLKDFYVWANTTYKTLISKNGKRWWVTEWTGKATPYAIYFPTQQQYDDALKRQVEQKAAKK
jgi:hypothetical protein